jgi:CAAX prenyl protease-like protein
MKALVDFLQRTPLHARVAPFVIFIVLTALQGQFGEASRYWFYLAKTVIGAWLVLLTWPLVKEMRWKFSWEAVVAGVAVFALWVGLHGIYPKASGTAQPWNPHVQFGEGSALALFFIIVRIAGSTLVVPHLEEVFYRSFLYRYIEKQDFLSVPLGFFAWKPFIITTVIFALTHGQPDWLAAILCGFIYQGLVCWKKRLGDAMTAHAITNFLLGLWVVWKGAWQFW